MKRSHSISSHCENKKLDCSDSPAKYANTSMEDIGNGEIIVDEEYILNCTKQQSLIKITKLCLSNLGLKEVSEVVFSLSNLQHLDVSNNEITQISIENSMQSLTYLDIRNNVIDCILFANKTPNLQTIFIEENNFSKNRLTNQSLLCTMCPLLEYIDKENTKLVHQSVNVAKNTMREQIKAVFSVLFNENDYDSLKENPKIFISKLIPCIENQWKDVFTCFLIDTMAYKFIYDLREKLLSCRPLDSLMKLDKRNRTPSRIAQETICNQFIPDKSKATDRDNPLKRTRSTLSHRKKPVPVDPRPDAAIYDGPDYDFDDFPYKLITPPSHCDYTPKHMNRCHYNGCKKSQSTVDQTLTSGEDDLNCNTKVWQLAFEPNPDHPDQQLDTFATCGGSTVCLMDCASGKVIKRYKDMKEQFYCLSWTTTLMKNDNGKSWNTNILAVAGINGHIKLFLPSELICYSEIGNGRPFLSVTSYYATTMVFHKVNPHWMFVAYSDASVVLYDIGTPECGNYKNTISQLNVFVCSPNISVLNMVISEQCKCFVAGTENGCFLWTTEDQYKPRDCKIRGGKIYQKPTCELKFNEIDYKMVDGLCLVNRNIIATKFVNCDSILIWSICLVVNSIKRESGAVKSVNVLMALKWENSPVDFIVPTGNNNTLLIGNEQGDIYIYKIPKVDPKNKKKLEASKILKWPNVKYDTNIDRCVINFAVIRKDSKYVIAGTDNNIVCIWQNT